jgi:vitamin B12 transporter
VTADPPLDAARRNVGLYGQALVDLGPRILLNLGGRVDQNQKFGTHGTYRLGGVLKVSRRFRVRAAVGSGFKEPSLRENYVQTAFEVGNPDLKPEESRSWELGVEHGLLNGTVTLSASYFDQRFRNLIQYNGAAAVGSPSYENVAKATARGVELTGSLRPGHGISVTGSYTFLRTRVEDPGFSTAPGDVFAQGQPLIRRPRHTTRLDGRARIADRATLGVAANVIASREDVDFRPFPSVRTTLPAFVTVDLDAGVDLLRETGRGPVITATFRVENLLNERYEMVVGFPARSRAVLAGARVGF